MLTKQLTILVVLIAIGADALARHAHFSSISTKAQKHHLLDHHHSNNNHYHNHLFEESFDEEAIKNIIDIVARRYSAKISVAEYTIFSPSSSESLEFATMYFASRLFSLMDLEIIERLKVSPEICTLLIAVSEEDINTEAVSTEAAIESLAKSVTPQKMARKLHELGQRKKQDAKQRYMEELIDRGFSKMYVESLSDQIDEVILAAIELPDNSRFMAKSAKYLFSGSSTSGHFKHFREELDSSYHGHYTPQRIAFQDRLLQQYLDNGPSRSDHPWLLFSGGPMGAGKGYVMASLDSDNILPMRRFLVSDFDDIREKLPEFSLMNAINPKAMGHFTQPEVAMLSELLQNIGLANSVNVLVDGSLQNADWYSQVFTQMKSKYPDYQFALIFVIADLDQVKKQVAHREQKVGRSVPSSVVKSAYDSCVQSMKVLPTHQAIDLSLIFYNQNGKAPTLVEKRVRTGITDFGILEKLADLQPSSQGLSILDDQA